MCILTNSFSVATMNTAHYEAQAPMNKGESFIKVLYLTETSLSFQRACTYLYRVLFIGKQAQS